MIAEWFRTTIEKQAKLNPDRIKNFLIDFTGFRLSTTIRNVRVEENITVVDFVEGLTLKFYDVQKPLFPYEAPLSTFPFTTSAGCVTYRYPRKIGTILNATLEFWYDSPFMHITGEEHSGSGNNRFLSILMG